MAKRKRWLRNVRNVWQYGEWAKGKGFRVGEQRSFGGVHNVHSTSSLHYREQVGGRIVVAEENQGTLAFDINYDTGKGKRFKSETEALTWLYHKTRRWAKRHRIPLDEMFFDGFGFIKERGYDHNHPISGHDGHGHVGFYREWFRK